MLFYLVALLFPLVLIWLARCWESYRVTRLASGYLDRLPVVLSPLACVVFLAAFVLESVPAGPNPDWVGPMLTIYASVIWFALAAALVPHFGLSARDDVVERRNRGATVAILGAQAAITACLAEGIAAADPTDPEDFGMSGVFHGVLATLVLFLFWGILQAVASFAEAITVDRDGAAAWRLAGWLIAAGLLAGEAAADLFRPGPDSGLQLASAVLVALFLVAVILEPQWPRRSLPPASWVWRRGLVPAAAVVGITVLFSLVR
jgi:hypothetical protein